MMSPPNNHTSSRKINAITTQFDAEEKNMQSRILEIRRQRNAAVPVSWMPDEVLEIVFREYARDLFIHFGDPWGIVGLTHVCSLWRRVGLSSSRIWYLVDVCRERLTKEFLSRSRQGPIRTFLKSSLVSNSQLDLLVDNGHRIDALFLTANSSTLERILGCLNPSAKNLRILSLESNSIHLLKTEIVTTPCLKQICLRRAMLSISKCDSLTHLSISEYCGNSVARILTLLSRSSQLEEIHLSNIDVTSLTTKRETKIVLMNLRLLVMTTVSCPGEILANIICSPFAKMHLHAMAPGRTLSDLFTDGISDLHFLHSADEQMIGIHPNGFILFRNSRDEMNDTNSVFSILCSPITDMPLGNSLTPIATQASVRSLHIRNVEVQELESGTLLKSFPFITFLWISDTTVAATEHLIRQLCKRSKREPLCPSLIMLKVEGVYFDVELSNTMSRCFEYRSENGAKLERLELVSCYNVFSSAISQWKEVVKNVEVKSEVFTSTQSPRDFLLDF